MKNLIFKGLNGPFKIATATQYITRIKDSTNKKREKELTELLLTLENALINNENKLEEYLVVKKEWEKFQTEKLNGSIIRSKAIWAEDGEKIQSTF